MRFMGDHIRRILRRPKANPLFRRSTHQKEFPMPVMRPLDPAFPIERQIALEAAPVVLVNVFTLDQADEQAFVRAWQDDAGFMKRQPGFISTQLHRAIGESPTYLNYAVWESTADFRAAFGHPEFRARLSVYPPSAVASPHLFQKVAVPGICVA
jgi:heme-degrading monooxygenase HmoA